MTVADTMYVEWIDGEAVVLNRRTGELHYLNPTAATVLASVQEHGIDRGVAEVVAHFGLTGESEAELRDLLADMAARGIVGPAQNATPETDPREPRAPGG